MTEIRVAARCRSSPKSTAGSSAAPVVFNSGFVVICTRRASDISSASAFSLFTPRPAPSGRSLSMST